MTEAELVSGYKESLKIAWGYNDYSDWPIKLSSIMHLFAGDFSKNIIKCINKLDNGTIDVCVELAKMYSYPGRLFRLIDPFIFGARVSGIPLKEQRRIVLLMLKAVTYLKNEDIFCLKGTNRLINLNINKYDTGLGVSEEIVKRLQAILFLYCETVFFRGHDAGKSIHGPYITSSHGYLFIREYYNLNNNDLVEREYRLAYDRISIACEYDTLPASIDSYDHLHFIAGSNAKIVNCKVYFDDQLISQEENILQLCEEIQWKVIELHRLCKVMSWTDITNKYADIFWFRIKPLLSKCNEPLKPDDAVYANIKNGAIDERRKKNNLSPREINLLINLSVGR